MSSLADRLDDAHGVAGAEQPEGGEEENPWETAVFLYGEATRLLSAEDAGASSEKVTRHRPSCADGMLT